MNFKQCTGMNNSTMIELHTMKFKYETLYKKIMNIESTQRIQSNYYSFKRHKKNIIHIRLTNHTGYPDKLIEWVFPMETFQTEYRLQKEQFPLENRIILVEIFPLKFKTKFVPTETKKKFSGKSSKTKLIYLKESVTTKV